MITIQKSTGSVTFFVFVQPGSSRAAVIGSHQGALKVKLTAPPVGGAANKQCIQLLAKALKRPKSSITIAAGHTSRLKKIQIQPRQGEFKTSEAAALKHLLMRLSKGST